MDELDMSTIETTRHSAAACQCGNLLDASSGDGNPSEGDISICFYCGRLCIYGPGIVLRPATREETKNIMQSEQGNFVRRAQHAVRMKL